MHEKQEIGTHSNKTKLSLTGDKKILAGVLVAAVAGIVAKMLLERHKSADDSHITALAKNQIEPDVDGLPSIFVNLTIEEPVNMGRKRRFIERAISGIFGVRK